MGLWSAERSSVGKAAFVAPAGLPLLAVLLLALSTALVFGLGTSTGSLATYFDASCSANGEFHLATRYWAYSRYNPYWQGSLFLSITLGFGNLSYAWARSIDVCWDLLVGRGGQALLCLLAYPVIRRSLFGYMKQAPVRIPLYTAIAFDRVSHRTLCTLVRDVVSGLNKSGPIDKSTNARIAPRAWRWRYVGFALILIYILVFPTLVSVMTGYQTKYIPFIQRPDDGFLVKFSQLETPPLVVRDGHRIGLRNDHAIYKSDPNYSTLLAYAGTSMAYNIHVLEATLDHNVTCFDPRYFGDAETIRSSNIPALAEFDHPHYPRQNRTFLRDKDCSLMFNSASSKFTSSTITLGSRMHHLEEPPLDMEIQSGWMLDLAVSTTRRYLSVDDLALGAKTMQLRGLCQPSNHYVWGFSSLLLFVFCVSSILFATILSALHIETLWSSRADRWHYDVNLYRDAIDLVYELQDRFFGDDLRSMSAQDLKKELEGSDKGISLESSKLPLSWKEQQSGASFRGG